MKRAELTKPLIYQDRKYLLLKWDSLNWGITKKSRQSKSGWSGGPTNGYYSTCKEAIIALCELRTEDNLIKKINIDGPFKNIKDLTEAYYEVAKQIVDNTIENIDFKKVKRAET